MILRASLPQRPPCLPTGPPRRRRSRAAFACAVLVLAAATACREPPREMASGDDRAAEVRAVTARIIQADNAGDLEAVVELYSDDAILLPPGAAPIRGRAAIRDHYARIFREQELELDITSEETRVAGEWEFDRGTTRGRALPKGGGAAVQFDDKYVMLLRRDGERGWRIARLIWNAGGGGAE